MWVDRWKHMKAKKDGYKSEKNYQLCGMKNSWRMKKSVR